MAVSTLSFRSYISKLKGRRLGAFKRAAVLLGITFDDYIGRVERGEKSCIDCRQWKDKGDFGVDSSRWDGVSSKCRSCSSIRHAEYHEPIQAEQLSRMGPKRIVNESSDKETARHLVNLEVRTGIRPSPNDLFCVKCGHKGDDKRHEYHHHMGYGPDHTYDVVPLCITCHHGEK